MAASPSALHCLAQERAALTSTESDLRAAKRRLADQARAAARKAKRRKQTETAAGIVAALAPPPDREAAVEEFWGRSFQAPGGLGPEAPPALHVLPEPEDAVHGGGASSSAGPVPAVAGSGPLKRARSFWHQRRLRRWVQHLNADAGLAPSTAHCWAVYRGYLDGTAEPAEAIARAAAGTSRRMTQWVRRWRRRWLLRRRAPRPGAALPTETLRAKARGRKGGWGGDEKSDPRPVPGTQNGAHFPGLSPIGK